MGSPEFVPTADLVDQIGDDVRSCDTQFQEVRQARLLRRNRDDGALLQDNALLKEVLGEDNPGGAGDRRRRVGPHRTGGRPDRRACPHPRLGGPSRQQRHPRCATIDGMDIGIKALGTNPRKSSKTGAGA